MYTFIQILAFLGIILLTIVAVVLIYYNWNMKVQTSLFTIYLGFIATTIISVFLSLKSEHKESILYLPIVSDVSNHRVFDIKNIEMPEDYLSGQNNTFNIVFDFWGFSNTVAKIDSKTISEDYFREIKSDVGFRNISFDLIQHFLLKTINDIHSTKNSYVISSASNFAGANQNQYKPFDKLDYYNFDETDVYRLFKNNNFSKFYIDNYPEIYGRFRLPKGMKCKSYLVEEQLENKEKKLLSIYIKNYFHIDFILSTGTAYPNGQMPGNLIIKKDSESIPRTYVFPIIIKINFERLTSGSLKTELYKDWSDWFVNQITQKVKF